MHLFLTSSPCDPHVPDGCDLPCILWRRNHFVQLLQERFQTESRCVMIASAPWMHERNDEMLSTFHRAFAYHGMAFSHSIIVDDRNAEQLPQLLAHSDIVILAGGHVPTQNAFLAQLRLRPLLQSYEGIVMGISAGTMNCCDVVYAQPEEPGEATNPHYQRFLPGLGLTNVMILPHYQQVKNSILDGMRLFEDITYRDSMGRTFYALVDGSFVLCEQIGRAHV